VRTDRATKHGSTRGIAEAIAGTISGHGIAAEVLPVEGAGEIGPYDADVLGSAIYMGRLAEGGNRVHATPSSILG
jgi:menaquinone-dependent protoporphyrinogen oxidase